MKDPSRILVLADLHLAAGRHDPFDADHALASFLGAQLDVRDSPGLILLGDTFDFVLTPGRRVSRRADASLRGALERLESIAAAHEQVFGALADFLAGGATIDIVPGNHDIELMRPAVQERLATLLGQPPAARLRVQPWIVHLPGLLYAEHGHQHHDLNAFCTLLEPWRADGQLELPLGTQLTHLQVHAPPGAKRQAAAVAAEFAGRAVSPRAWRRLRRYRTRGLAAEAQRTGLPRETLASLDAVTPRTPAAMTSRLVRNWFASRPGSVMTQVAAGRVHRLLSARERDVRFYVFGHSHVAQRRSIAPGEQTPLYLNPGTWSGLRRSPDRQIYPYIEIIPGGPEPSAELRSWPCDDASGPLPSEPARYLVGDGARIGRERRAHLDHRD
jgi:UDP-2,3-diacylglucosamine pyrophosphatase LpxH